MGLGSLSIGLMEIRSVLMECITFKLLRGNLEINTGVDGFGRP